MKIKHPLSYEVNVRYIEINEQPSETIPDQSLTVKQILQRFTSGTLPSIAKETYFEDNPDIDDPDPMYAPNFDLVDYEEAKRKLERRIKYRRQSNQNAVNKRALEENKAVMSEAVAE